jgi:hypothetical protein
MKLKLSEIHPNPNNPRLIKDDKFIGKEDWIEATPIISGGAADNGS